jgi:hypothetical protein
MEYGTSPGYLHGADLHNVGSGTDSFFDAPIDNTVDFVAKIPAFAVTSIASGINSIYNSGVVAGNFLGISDAQENDLQQTLGNFDDNLGQYYEAHKSAVDLTGFVATSFVPGLGGVKLMNTGQRMLSGAMKTGGVGRSLAEATGLVETLGAGGKSLTQIAGEALAQGNQTFTVMNSGVLKAIAGGVGQATLDSFAFEAMVQATMFRSPILEQQDISDIGHNILVGTVLGGAIGGAFNAAGVYGGVKKILVGEDLRIKPFTQVSGTHGLTDASDRMVIRAGDMSLIPEGVDAKTIQLGKDTLNNLRLANRKDMHALTGGGEEGLGNQIADLLDTLPHDQVANVIGGAKLVARPGYIVTAGEGGTVAHVRLHGTDGVGDVTFDALRKGEQTLADAVTPLKGQTPKQAIDAVVDSHKFTPAKQWRMATASGAAEVEARYIWAETKAVYKSGMTINVTDIPLLEGALKRGIADITVDDGVHSWKISNLDDLKNEVIRSKQELAHELTLAKNAAWTTADGIPTSAEIAKAVNVSVKSLESQVGGEIETGGASMFARQDAQKAFDAARVAAGQAIGEVSNLAYIPQHVKVVYDATRSAGVNSDLVSAITNVAMVQKIAKQKADMAFSNFSTELNGRFPKISQREISGSNRYGAGAGVVTSANGDYLTLASKVEAIGKATADLITQTQKRTSDVIESVALRLRGDQAGAIEFSKLNDLRNSTVEKYVLNDAGDGLIVKSVKEYQDAVRAGKGKANIAIPVLQEGIPEQVKFVNANAADAIKADIKANGNRVEHENALRQAEGAEGTKDASGFYGWKPDPKSMKFFAFVKDETITGKAAGHTSMIHAATEEQLSKMIEKARTISGMKVYTKEDTKNFFEAHKSYEFDRTLHENYIDSSLKSAGINNQFFPKTDPDAIVNEWTASHLKRDSALARDAVAVKYGNEFDQLEQLGKQYTGTASSQYGVTAKSIETTMANPYNDYRKTALNISRLGEYPLLSSVNRGLSNAVDGTIQHIVDAWKEVKVVSDLDRINTLLSDAGISHAYKSAAELILANHTMPKPYLSNFIRGANTILANTFLRLDFLNPIANAVGAQVLLGSETRNIHKQLLRDMDVAGVTVPGTNNTILSPNKLIAKANADWFKDTLELDQSFKFLGLTSSMRDQMKSMLRDDLTLAGGETVAQTQTMLTRALAKAQQLTETGEKITGNKLAEEYNRFISAHVAKQVAGARVASGLMSVDDVIPFMNTFVNRTQTNALASQRPLLFQGPVGQAIGLFQSFQFNTMQQLFRGVSEGGAKDAAMMMGLQGTMFGLNGLPAFQYINQHIIGTASGNKNHTDAYSALYGAAGKTAGDWLMYGIPSNLLQTNLYSRGDINPRTLTVVPVAPQDVIAVSAFTKFASNLKETVGKIAGGGDVWQSVLQGLEHNGISRPLSGLAQTMQAAGGSGKVFSTTNAGDVSFTNDLMSLATLSRLAGGKPLDEALANDEVSRSMVYKAADKVRLKTATETFKSSVIGKAGGGESIDPTVVHDYMAAFVRNGGRVESFNQNMLNTMTRTSTPRANQIIGALKGPYAEHMKSLMGGSVEDFRSQPALE